MQIKFGERVYDTRRSVLLGSWMNDRDLNSAVHLEEHLYRTHFGGYFLYGRGGVMTRFARPENGKWVPGEGIEPMRREYAEEWARDRLTHEQFLDAFGAMNMGSWWWNIW